MVHSVYSDKDVFLRELISNAADACERLRYEAIATPALLGDDAKSRIVIKLDADARVLTLEDNGIGMSRDEMVEALGTIARSGTKAFMERIEASKAGESASLIGQFGVGFYSAFMVADKVDVISRRAGSADAWRWSSDGKGTFTVTPEPAEDAPARGTRVVLHLMEDAKDYTERYKIESIIQRELGPRSGADFDCREARRGGGGARRRRRDLDPAALRDQARGIHRLLPQLRRLRRAGADGAFPRRGPPRVHRARLRAAQSAVRPLSTPSARAA